MGLKEKFNKHALDIPMYPKVQKPLKLDIANQGRLPRARKVSVMARLSTKRLDDIRRLLYLECRKNRLIKIFIDET